MEFETWKEEFNELMKMKEFFERQTRHHVAIQIHEFMAKSKASGRSEHFLSGLSAAISIVDSTFEQDQMTLFELFSSHPSTEDH